MKAFRVNWLQYSDSNGSFEAYLQTKPARPVFIQRSDVHVDRPMSIARKCFGKSSSKCVMQITGAPFEEPISFGPLHLQSQPIV